MPAMVISPRLPHRKDIVTIVPISLTAPVHKLPFTVRLSRNDHPQEPDEQPCWAKCDMASVKAYENSGVSMSRDLKGVIERECAGVGVLMTMTEPTKPMISGAASAGLHEAPSCAPIIRPKLSSPRKRRPS